MRYVASLRVVILLPAVGTMLLPTAMGGATSSTAFTYRGQLKQGGVPAGDGNAANGNFSFAAGKGATTDHTGSFVRSDSLSNVASTADNQFIISADGGGGHRPKRSDARAFGRRLSGLQRIRGNQRSNTRRTLGCGEAFYFDQPERAGGRLQSNRFEWAYRGFST